MPDTHSRANVFQVKAEAESHWSAKFAYYITCQLKLLVTSNNLLNARTSVLMFSTLHLWSGTVITATTEKPILL